MNDVPPSQPPSDDIDSFYRRASALDPSRPSDRTREAVLAHARKVVGSDKRWRWCRPALFGTLAAAGLAGLLALPQILTPGVAPKANYATAPGAATPTPQVARAPEAEPGVSPIAPPPPTRPALKNAPMRERDATDRREAKANTTPGANAEAGASAALSARRDAARQPEPPELDSIAVTGQRVAPRALESPSRAAPIAPTESAPAAASSGVDKTLTTPAGSAQALRLAAEAGDLERLQRLLDQSTDVDSRDDAGRTALLLATLHGQADAVAFLLSHGANPSTADANGVTPLSAAISGNHAAIVRMLKHAGAR